MFAGLTAGGLATILAVLLSLPLVSPHDGLFNSASVALAGLLVAVLAGMVGRIAGGRAGNFQARRFGLLWLPLSAGLTGAALYAMAASGLENYWPFTMVLAAVLFGGAGGGAVLLRRYAPNLPWWAALPVIILALTLGWLWRESGDQPGGGLELPPPAARQLPYIPSVRLSALSANVPGHPEFVAEKQKSVHPSTMFRMNGKERPGKQKSVHP